MQKLILIILFTGKISYAQTITNNTNSVNALIVGLGIGAGTLNLRNGDTVETTLSTTLPNFKIGYRFNHKIALCMLLPGANYKYNNKDRGFEAFVPAIQYWIYPDWWTLLGCSVTFDAPTFYTVKDPKKANFYTGVPAITLATGYEIYHLKKFYIDIQYRLFTGRSVLANHHYRNGISNMLIIGCNWKL